MSPRVQAYTAEGTFAPSVQLETGWFNGEMSYLPRTVKTSNPPFRSLRPVHGPQCDVKLVIYKASLHFLKGFS